MIDFSTLTEEDQEIIQDVLEYKPKKLSRKAEHYDVYVSLTSSPERLSKVGIVLNLLDLSHVKEIHVNIPKFYRNDRKGPKYKEEDIEFLQRLDSRIKIFVLPTDLGPATKIIPTLQRIRKKNSLVISIDDDVAYPLDMVNDLINNAAKYTKNIICMSGFTFNANGMGEEGEYYEEQTDWDRGLWPNPRRVKYPYIDVLEGFSGVCYNKSLMTPSVIRLIMKINGIDTKCKLSDDLTISYSLAAHRIPIRSLRRHEDMVPFPYGEQGDALHAGSGVELETDSDWDPNFLKYAECLQMIYES